MRSPCDGRKASRVWVLALAPLLQACGDDLAPDAPTALEVTARTMGLDIDPDGYVLSVDGAEHGVLDPNGTITVTALSPGNHLVELTGAAPNCSLVEAARVVTLTTGATLPVTFQATCTATSGVIELLILTVGTGLDPDGYGVRLDADAPRPVAMNETMHFTGVEGGDHTLALAGLSANCTVDGARRTVKVTTGTLVRDTARTAFNVRCVGPVARIVTRTLGSDIDADGYVVVVDCPDPFDVCPAPSLYMASNDTVLMEELQGPAHSLALGGVAANCRLDGTNPRAVELLADTVDVVFSLDCLAFGFLRVTTRTTGVDPDANGYRVGTYDVPAEGSITLPRVLPGFPTPVRLEGVSVNCHVATPNPAYITVAPGETAEVAFAVTCEAAPYLAVQRFQDGSWELYSLKLNDAAPRRLTHLGSSDTEPAWSPDGERIAFTSDREGKAQIYVMRAGGSGTTRLTHLTGAQTAGEAAWSPDGSQVAFTADDAGAKRIGVVDADGSNLRWLVASGESPAWSPDGSKIAYGSGGDVLVASADGSRATRLGPGTHPVWSPDGLRIAFVALYPGVEEWEGPYTTVKVMRSDGSGVTSLWPGGWSPAWSPDGRWIAYQESDRLSLGAADGSWSREVGVGSFQPDWRR